MLVSCMWYSFYPAKIAIIPICYQLNLIRVSLSVMMLAFIPIYLFFTICFLLMGISYKLSVVWVKKQRIFCSLCSELFWKRMRFIDNTWIIILFDMAAPEYCQTHSFHVSLENSYSHDCCFTQEEGRLKEVAFFCWNCWVFLYVYLDHVISPRVLVYF